MLIKEYLRFLHQRPIGATNLTNSWLSLWSVSMLSQIKRLLWQAYLPTAGHNGPLEEGACGEGRYLHSVEVSDCNI